MSIPFDRSGEEVPKDTFCKGIKISGWESSPGISFQKSKQCKNKTKSTVGRFIQIFIYSTDI